MFESNPGPAPEVKPTNPGRPVQPGEEEMGAKQLEALKWAQSQAGGDPGAVQVLASQYLYKHYGILPNNGQGDWQHGSGGGAYGWELKNGDLVPKDRSWFEKYGMLAVTLGVMSAGTLSALTGGGAAAGGGAGAGGGTGAGTAAGGAGTAAGASSLGKTLLTSPVLGAGINAGLGALESFLQPRQQSFADGSETDPRNLLKRAHSATNDIFNSANTLYHSGVNLPDAHVQQPPNFAGPSLPMSFGVSGQDSSPTGVKLGVNGQIGPGDPAAGVPTNDKDKALAAFKMLGIG